MKARRMIDKLKDGPKKESLAESANVKEALSLAAKGDLADARRLAEQLNKVVSVVKVYPLVVSKCVAAKDQACASSLVLQAVKQLQHADATPPPLPEGIPASAVAGRREFDPILNGFDKLAGAILPLDETLAWEVLDERWRKPIRANSTRDWGGSDSTPQPSTASPGRTNSSRDSLRKDLKTLYVKSSPSRQSAVGRRRS